MHRLLTLIVILTLATRILYLCLRSRKWRARRRQGRRIGSRSGKRWTCR